MVYTSYIENLTWERGFSVRCIFGTLIMKTTQNDELEARQRICAISMLHVHVSLQWVVYIYMCDVVTHAYVSVLCTYIKSCAVLKSFAPSAYPFTLTECVSRCPTVTVVSVVIPSVRVHFCNRAYWKHIMEGKREKCNEYVFKNVGHAI